MSFRNGGLRVFFTISRQSRSCGGAGSCRGVGRVSRVGDPSAMVHSAGGLCTRVGRKILRGGVECIYASMETVELRTSCYNARRFYPAQIILPHLPQQAPPHPPPDRPSTSYMHHMVERESLEFIRRCAVSLPGSLSRRSTV